jgi:tRNA pseudouridine38-40 synthase
MSENGLAEMVATESADSAPSTRYKAVIEYDGTRYHGFQRQAASQITIQGVLENALGRISRPPVVVTGAGRTDRGVHAQGQVISFCLSWRHDIAALQRAINANLPADIAVLTLQEALPRFHPRFSALERAYRYTIFNAPVRRPLLAGQSWHISRLLDLAAMNRAASHLVGTHDFATFGRPTSEGGGTVRTVLRAEWRREGDLLLFDIEANAFLMHMVRSVVGSLKAVGEGAWSDDNFLAALLAANRACAGPTAPPHGLTLISVRYADDADAQAGPGVEN